MGFEMAGFDIVWTNECDPAFIRGYESGMTAWRRSEKRNEPARIVCKDRIENIPPDRIIVEAFPHGKPVVWGVIGGPPCPDFSNGGKKLGRDGSNGKLSEVLVRRICKLLPDFFLIENVPGLLKIKRHKEFFDELVGTLKACKAKYVCDVASLNAIEFGVPQDRNRVFLVGVTPAVFGQSLRRPPRNGENGWFKWPEPKYPGALHAYDWPEVSSRRKKPERPEGIPAELMVGTHLDGNNPPQVHPNAGDQFRPYSQKFRTTKEGDISHKSFKRLHRWRYSPTAAYGNNEVHLHPWEDRRLSVREVLRLQSVPDEYILPSDMTLTTKFKMIANGVPVKLAYAVAVSLGEFLVRHKRKR